MKSESEVLGVPNKYKKLDADLKFELTKPKFIVILFTIRNIELTAYMHNGVFKTLESD
jgi:cytochrome c peroxidase